MKVIYYTKPFFADCDFPLIQELQKKGVDVRVYMPIHNKFKSASIIEFDKPFTKWGLIKASKLKEMQIYSECIDLNRLYLICGQRLTKWWPFSWLLYIITLVHMIFLKADVFHLTWQLEGFEKIILKWNFKGRRIFTVHDPFSHLGNDSESEENNRLDTITWSKHYVLLSKQLSNAFIEKYKIKSCQISFSSLGSYDSYNKIQISELENRIDFPYILYFGTIKKYKGIEYLIEAMDIVHKSCPNLKLIIAGFGEIYFEKEINNHYIEIRNRYIGLSELISLIKKSQFTVCPYVEATQSGVVQTSFSLDCPIIVTDVGNLGAVVDNDITGIVVPPKNSQILAKSIIRLYSSKNLLSQMKRNIIEKWMPQMSWSKIADTYINIYKG